MASSAPELKMAPFAAGLWKKFPVYQVFGANTNVGKTIFSTIICRSMRDGLKLDVRYLKPVSTGSSDEADIVLVSQAIWQHYGQWYFIG